MSWVALEFAPVNQRHNLFANGGQMRTKTCILTLAVCFVTAAVCFAADDPQVGTWKLNEAKSKIAPGAPKNTTVVYEVAGDSIRVTLSGTAPDGTTTHSEWTGKIDGKDYPSTGNPNEDTRSYRRIDDHRLQFVSKKAGKVVLSGQVVISADGKTRTVTSGGTDPQGKKFKSTAVYEKQ
jgi:hypothetical protein